jgi:hypothetical protein
VSNRVSAGNRYEVRVDWATVVPRGDTLEVNAVNGVDESWVEALEVVLDEHQRQVSGQQWGKFDFEYEPGEKAAEFVLYIKEIKPGVQSVQVRQTVNDLVKSANSVAQVGTHVYDLARELRGQPDDSRESTPPPGLDPLLDELRADAA